MKVFTFISDENGERRIYCHQSYYTTGLITIRTNCFINSPLNLTVDTFRMETAESNQTGHPPSSHVRHALVQEFFCFTLKARIRSFPVLRHRQGFVRGSVDIDLHLDVSQVLLWLSTETQIFRCIICITTHLNRSL